MLGFVIIVWYVGLIVKVGKSVRGMWWVRARGGVNDGDSGVCVGVDSMRIVAPECNFVLYVGVSMCKFVLNECVTCVSAFFCRCDAVAWELEALFLVCERGLCGEVAWSKGGALGRIFQARCLAELWWSGLRYGSAYAEPGQWVWKMLRWCEDGCLPEVLGCSLSCQWVTGLSARVDRRYVIFSGSLELCPTAFLGCVVWGGE